MIEVDYNDIQEAKERLKAEEKRTIRFCDFMKLKNQLEQLKYEMVNNYTYSFDYLKFKLHITSKPPIPKFYLFCCECGTGKTYVVVNKVIDFLEKYSISPNEEFNHGMLFVMEHIETLKFYKKRLDYLLNNVYVETIDSDTKDVNFKLQTFPVIFITHQMYKSLAGNEQKRKEFSANRKLLVIDEFINMCDTVFMDKVKLEKIRADLKYMDIQIHFDDAIIELTKYFEQLQTNGKDKDSKLHIFNTKTKYSQIVNKIEQIKNEVKISFTEKEKAIFYKENNQKSIFNVLDEVTQFYNGTCILENGTLHTPKRNLDYWFLEKNIVLDASARINNVYSLRKKQFKDMLDKDFQVLDHKNWTIELIEINTTDSAKKRYKNLDKICSNVLMNLGKNRTLVVTQMKECIDKNGNTTKEFFDTDLLTYFQKTTGSNEHQNIQNILIAHTFNIQEKQYILEYLYYSRKDFKTDDDIKILTHNRRRHFENINLENYRIGRIANEFYQAIKRVNRDMSKETRIVIITKDVEAVKIVYKMLKNCKFINSTNDYNIEYKKDESKTMGNSNNDIKAIKIFKAILENKQDEIPISIKESLKYEKDKVILKKQDLRKTLEIEHKENLGREVLNKANVKQFIKENNINTAGQTIKFKS